MKTSDIIVLENSDKYALLQQIKYEDEKYFFASFMDENDRLIKEKSLFFKELKEDNDIYVEVVSDENLIICLTKKLKDTFK